MDQTPAPFQYLSGRTYAEKGSKMVRTKTGRVDGISTKQRFNLSSW